MSRSEPVPPSTSITSTSDLFARYSVPTIRIVQRNLNHDLSATRTKLRGLVSTRYRDLLETAQGIVTMDTQMRGAINELDDIVKGCDPRAINRRTRNAKQITQGKRESNTYSRASIAARARLLGICPVVAIRLLRGTYQEDTTSEAGKKDHLRAAIVLVLARLLYSSISKEDIPLVTTIKKQVESLRTALLQSIKRTLADSTADHASILSAFSAEATIENASAGDILHRFLSARRDKINELLTRPSPEGQDLKAQVLAAQDLLIKTLHDARSLAPKSLPRALQSLSTTPLFQRKDVQALVELGLPDSESQLGSVIAGFTLFPRADDLSATGAAKSMVLKWKLAVLKSFVKGVTRLLEDESSFQVVVELRQAIFENWVDKVGITPEELELLRKVFSDRLSFILQETASKSQSILELIRNSIEKWEDVSQVSIWDKDLTSIEIVDGASVFRQTVYERSRGLGPKETAILTEYLAQKTLVDNIELAILDMQKHKWDIDDSTSDSSDSEDNNETRTDLSALDQDPELLMKQRATLTARQSLSLAELISELTNSLQNTTSQVQKVAFLLRLLRELALPAGSASLDGSRESTIKSLFSLLADSTSSPPLETFAKALKRGIDLGSYTAPDLWIDEIPSLPSKQIFQLLSQLSRAMSATGTDLWTPLAKKEMCSKVNERCFALLQDVTKAMEADSGKEAEGLVKKQTKFDIAFLEAALGDKKDTIRDDEKLRAAAKEAWTRVEGLFGLFGP
jgi:hypothetical protein